VKSKVVTISESTIAIVESHLQASDGTLYAILDSVDEPEVPERASLFESRYTSLYSGAASREYWAIAPYLLQVQQDDFDWIRTTLITSPWGILATSKSDLTTVRHHFRKFLTVKDAALGRSLLFRFYDPRVLPVFLESCSADQARAFYGPIDSFYCFSAPDTCWRLNLTKAS
jgi:hypothetical protein